MVQGARDGLLGLENENLTLVNIADEDKEAVKKKPKNFEQIKWIKNSQCLVEAFSVLNKHDRL